MSHLSENIDNIKVHKGRNGIYSVFAKIFLDIPSSNTYEMLENILPTFKALVEQADKKIVEAVELIEKNIYDRKNLSGSALEQFDNDLNRDFTRIFCLTDSVAVSESVYTSVDHLLMGTATGQVNAIYKSVDFVMDCKSNEPADHISYELTFMAYLALGITRHLEKANYENANILLQYSYEFLTKHLLKWAKDFVKAVAYFQESYELYAPIAYVMLYYISQDAQYLKDELDKE